MNQRRFAHGEADLIPREEAMGFPPMGMHPPTAQPHRLALPNPSDQSTHEPYSQSRWLAQPRPVRADIYDVSRWPTSPLKHAGAESDLPLRTDDVARSVVVQTKAGVRVTRTRLDVVGKFMTPYSHETAAPFGGIPPGAQGFMGGHPMGPMHPQHQQWQPQMR